MMSRIEVEFLLRKRRDPDKRDKEEQLWSYNIVRPSPLNKVSKEQKGKIKSIREVEKRGKDGEAGCKEEGRKGWQRRGVCVWSYSTCKMIRRW